MSSQAPDPFAMMLDNLKTLGERLYDLAQQVAGIKTQLKIVYGLFMLFLGGVISTFFFFVRG